MKVKYKPIKNRSILNSTSKYDVISIDGELTHFGILGMKWGVRRYQNEDGTLTEAGKKRYLKQYRKTMKSGIKDHLKSDTSRKLKAYNISADAANETIKRMESEEANGKKISVEEWNDAVTKASNDTFDRKLKEFEYEDILNNPKINEAIKLAEKYKLDEYDMDVMKDLELHRYAKNEYEAMTKRK